MVHVIFCFGAVVHRDSEKKSLSDWLHAFFFKVMTLKQRYLPTIQKLKLRCMLNYSMKINRKCPCRNEDRCGNGRYRKKRLNIKMQLHKGWVIFQSYFPTGNNATCSVLKFAARGTSAKKCWADRATAGELRRRTRDAAEIYKVHVFHHSKPAVKFGPTDWKSAALCQALLKLAEEAAGTFSFEMSPPQPNPPSMWPASTKHGAQQSKCCPH